MEENTLENEVQTVGEILRNARIKQGKTVSDASKELCIRKAYVEAIERMEVGNLPPMPYALGFVRSYSDYLGLNSDRIVSSYRKTVTGDTDDDIENVPHFEPSVPKLRHLLLGMFGLIILVAAWSYWQQLPQSEPEILTETSAVVPEPEIIDETQSAAEGSAPEEDAALLEESSENSVVGKEAIAEKEQGETITDENTKIEDSISAQNETTGRIRFVLTGPSWVELKQGENVLLSGIYHKGFEYTIPEGEGMIISIGRYYNAEFYIDGKKAKVVSSLKHTNVNLDEFLKQD
ncbi:MAG: DUF4115 domain-containing protein [Alphaproteobacteria bacterium]|nr:DUF4115 domain-containing protein [Alphaproteobacteria bacterium]